MSKKQKEKTKTTEVAQYKKNKTNIGKWGLAAILCTTVYCGKNMLSSHSSVTF